MSRRLAITVALVCALGALLAPSAFAAKVANPGAVTFTFTNGSLDINTNHFDAASSDDPVTATGTVQGNGNISISSMHFPDLPPIDGPLGEIEVSINVIGTPTGNVNPHTGAMNLSFVVRIDADGGGVGGDCHIGNINFNATTSGAGAVPYNPSTGTFTLAEHTFAVPGASGCSTFPVNVNNEINNELNLPSPSGQNHAVLSGHSSPVLGRAIVPSFTATPSNGAAPLNVNFDASSTFHSRPVSSYQWDFDGNGSFDQTTAGPTTSTTYNTPGTRTVKLRVTDVDGDFQETTRTVTSNPAPDLAIGKSHTGDFLSGDVHSYAIDVDNLGSQAATSQITVTDTLPAGFSFSGFTGAGWNCAPSGQDVICTTDDDLAAGGGSAAPLTIDVIAADGGFFTNVAVVDVSGDENASNDTAEDPTRVIQNGIDIAPVKTLEEETHVRGERSHYRIAVSNVGTATAVDRVRVVDAIPAGLTFVSASGGLDWVCNFTGGEVRCFSDKDVAPGQALHDIVVTAEVDSDAPSSIDNTATTTVNGETGPENDSSTHTAPVLGSAADYTLNKSHNGDFIKGETETYRIAVSNVGNATGANPITVTDQLPIGLEYDGGTGDGWNCSGLGQSVTCTHAGEVEPGHSLPGLTIKVKVHTAAAGNVVNTAAVFSDDDFNVGNDVDEDPTDVRLPRPDLTIDKSHAGNFTANSNGSWTIKVRNVSDERADGPTTVTDSLPAGLQYVSGGGSGWACNASGQDVTCTSGDSIAAGTTAPNLTITAKPPTSAGGTNVLNTATVSNADDTVASNNSDTDPTAIDFKQTEATTLTASPVVLNLLSGSNKVGVSAVLKDSDGDPIAGRPVRFMGAGWIQPHCTAVTDATGEARCQIDVKVLYGLLVDIGRYDVFFDGDLDYKASKDSNALIQIAKLKLL
jgi:uncharacterized repeat protein (TIGR01451 family)